MGWKHLQDYDYIANSIWNCLCVEFSQDPEFHRQYTIYWGTKNRYFAREKFLYFINSLMEESAPLPLCLLHNKDFIIAKLRYNNIYDSLDSPFITDPSIVLAALKYDAMIFRNLDIAYRIDKNYVLSAIQRNAGVMEYIDAKFLSDRTFILEAVNLNGQAILHAHESLTTDLELGLSAVNNDPRIFSYMHSTLRANKEIVLIAVTKYPYLISYVDHILQQNKTFMAMLIKQNYNILSHVGCDLKMNYDFMLEIIRYNGLAIQFIDSFIQEDLAIEAVNQNPYAFKCLHRRCRANKSIVLAAVTKEGDLLEFASAHLKSDPEIVLAALKSNINCYRFVHSSLKCNREFVLQVVQQTKLDPGLLLTYTSLTSDPSFMLSVIKINPSLSIYLSKSLRENKNFMPLVEKLSSPWKL